jgi:TetR/AcrR family transcriptional repressor of nem operon
MARIVKDPALRRNEILDTALRLVYSRGYEQMTIQDILNDLHLSKGAFYHYFDSKQALLESLIERMMRDAEIILLPIVHDPQLTAQEKLQRFFDASSRFKTAQKAFYLSLMRVWYADDNAIVRQKLSAAGTSWISPLLKLIICQGVAEGTFKTAYPEQCAEIVIAMLYGLGDALSGLLLGAAGIPDAPRRMILITAAFNDAFERVLGVVPGSMHLVDPQVILEWTQS